MSLTILRADHIARTAKKLSQRIFERFPESGLYEVSVRLLELGATAEIDAPRIARPIYWVRIAGGALIALILVMGTSLILTVLTNADQLSGVALVDLLEGLEAGTQQFILFGLAIFFLVTLEGRIKRGRALRRIHELRSMAHVIDMHQLTKDPDYYRGETIDTVHSPKRELSKGSHRPEASVRARGGCCSRPSETRGRRRARTPTEPSSGARRPSR